jgi:rare lipoprotein A
MAMMTALITAALLRAGCATGETLDTAGSLALAAPAPLVGQALSDGALPPPPGPSRYDTVGYAMVMRDVPALAPAISATHVSLPVGSFAELTALDSGKTIVIIIANGPKPRAGWLLNLSPGAEQLLGGSARAMIGVRVRRLDPPGIDQAALREGRPATERIDAPPVLLRALRKRLPAPPRDGVPLTEAEPRPMRSTPGASYPVPGRLAPASPPVTVQSGFFVQIAALSSPGRANALGETVGGSVQSVGGIYRVRLGPYADRASAERARADIAQRGYSEARIVRD